MSRTFKKRKQGLDEKFSKGHERDAGQVFGNGGLATAFVFVHALVPETNIGWVGFAASLAAVNADTWATELGVLNPTSPRLITELRKRVEKGTSGGISLFGTLASLLGSALIAALAAHCFTDNWSLFFLITFAGLAGSLFELVPRRDRASHVLLPSRSKRDRETSTPHLRHTDGSHPRLEMAGQ